MMLQQRLVRFKIGADTSIAFGALHHIKGSAMNKYNATTKSKVHLKLVKLDNRQKNTEQPFYL